MKSLLRNLISNKQVFKCSSTIRFASSDKKAKEVEEIVKTEDIKKSRYFKNIF